MRIYIYIHMIYIYIYIYIADEKAVSAHSQMGQAKLLGKKETGWLLKEPCVKKPHSQVAGLHAWVIISRQTFALWGECLLCFF